MAQNPKPNKTWSNQEDMWEVMREAAKLYLAPLARFKSHKPTTVATTSSHGAAGVGVYSHQSFPKGKLKIVRTPFVQSETSTTSQNALPQNTRYVGFKQPVTKPQIQKSKLKVTDKSK